MCYILIYFHVLNSYTHFKSVPTASHRFPLTDERERRRERERDDEGRERERERERERGSQRERQRDEGRFPFFVFCFLCLKVGRRQAEEP